MRTTAAKYGATAVVLLSVLMAGGLAGPAYGVTYNLVADNVTKTMPDSTVVTMWGFGCNGVQTGCDNTDITVPGPALVVPVGDTTLTINLTNNLAEPVSIVIPGLTPQLATVTPVKFIDGTGRQRVISFVNEATPGNTAAYTWNNVRPGTYLYESGTHPAVQVQMGLYGSVRKDFAAGQAYGPASSYTKELLLFFSEIDPVLHAAVADGTYGFAPAPTSTMYYQPRYFLINGEPYSPGRPPLLAVTHFDNTLVRFLSASLLTHVPMIGGHYMKVIAEDAHPYGNPKTQYAIDLEAGKTFDALINIQAPAGPVAVFDRKLGTMNGGASPGGMIAHIGVPTNIGVFRNRPWYLDVNGNGAWDAGTDAVAFFGEAGDVAVAGDWNGSGTTKIGVFRNRPWYLDANGNGAWDPGTDTTAIFGEAGDIPVAGDWNGSGTTKIGVFRNGAWYLDVNGNGAWDPGTDTTAYFGAPGDIPVVGDWNGSGTTKIGVFRNSVWYLDTNGNGVWNPGTDTVAFFGSAGDIPVAGDWNGSGTSKIGVFRNGAWYLDANGNGAWNPGTDTTANFGSAGDRPVTGKW